MKKLYILISFASLIFVGCSDSLDYSTNIDDKPRIEYSDCSGCLECLDLFSCTENAIKIDQRTQTAYIDADLCVGCMDCVNLFGCPENAFTISADNIHPTEINDIIAVSDTIGKLNIKFTATGDDSLVGSAYRYELAITNSNEELIENDFIPPIPQTSGTLEDWYLENLPSAVSINFSITVYDENDLASVPSSDSVYILGEMLDDIAPGVIEDVFVNSVTMNSLLLVWTAPGDDGNYGSASSYIIKVHTNNITESNWDLIEAYQQNLIPQEAGNEEQLFILELDPTTEYFIALKAIDDAENISLLSNVAQAVTSNVPDEIPPSAVNDLQAVPTDEVVELSWTSPGDDDMEGTAYNYEIRISQTLITEANWSDADLLVDPPIPLTAGTEQNYTVFGLDHQIQYYFAIKTFDEVGNEAQLSNIPNSELIVDIIPPSDILDLAVYEGYTSNLYTMKITWTSPGDNGTQGTADHYEIRYSNAPINESNWENAAIFPDAPSPQPAGSSQYCFVNVLNPAVIYYFAIKAFDENNNANQVSNSPAGKIVYQINTGACHNCSNCIYDCDENAILQGPGYKYIDADLCQTCGDCSCPYNLIYKAVIAY